MKMPLDTMHVRTRPKAKPKSAASVAAIRLYHAQTGRREADKEWDKALAAAVKAGVIPDHIASPEPVGTNRVTYADAELQVTLAVIAPITGVNFPGFVASLLRAGIDPKLISRNTRRHRTETKPAHRFTASLL